MSNGKIKKRFRKCFHTRDFEALGKLLLKYNWLGWFIPKEYCYLYDLPIGEG